MSWKKTECNSMRRNHYLNYLIHGIPIQWTLGLQSENVSLFIFSFLIAQWIERSQHSRIVFSIFVHTLTFVVCVFHHKSYQLSIYTKNSRNKSDFSFQINFSSLRHHKIKIPIICLSVHLSTSIDIHTTSIEYIMNQQSEKQQWIARYSCKNRRCIMTYYSVLNERQGEKGACPMCDKMHSPYSEVGVLLDWHYHFQRVQRVCQWRYLIAIKVEKIRTTIVLTKIKIFAIIFHHFVFNLICSATFTFHF